MDMARDYTEKWHHTQQIFDATKRPSTIMSRRLGHVILLTREAASDRPKVYGGCARLGQHRRAIGAVDRGKIPGAAGIRGIGAMRWALPKVSGDPAHRMVSSVLRSRRTGCLSYCGRCDRSRSIVNSGRLG